MRLIIGSLDDYRERMFRQDMCVMDCNDAFGYKVGSVINWNGVYFTIADIFIHNESECVWLVIKDKFNNLWELGVEWPS